jgi:HSF-type DNA-binding
VLESSVRESPVAATTMVPQAKWKRRSATDRDTQAGLLPARPGRLPLSIIERLDFDSIDIPKFVCQQRGLPFPFKVCEMKQHHASYQMKNGIPLTTSLKLMLLMLHIDKEHVYAKKPSLSENPMPPIDWCTRDTGEDSDHVIVIVDCERFVNDLLPMFRFRATSLASFVRKLFRWGFQQVSETYQIANKSQWDRPCTQYMFESQHFRKGNLPLLQLMNSCTAAGTCRNGKDQHNESTELVYHFPGTLAQAEQSAPNQVVPTDQAGVPLQPLSTSTSLIIDHAVYSNEKKFNTGYSGDAGGATFHQTSFMQGMRPSLWSVPTSTVAMQYILARKELESIEREQMVLQRAGERVWGLVPAGHTQVQQAGDSAAPFGQHAMDTVNLVRPSPASVEPSLLFGQAALNSISAIGTGTRGGAVATRIQGLSLGSPHSLPALETIQNGANQLPFMSSLLADAMPDRRNPFFLPGPPLGLGSSICRLVDWSNRVQTTVNQGADPVNFRSLSQLEQNHMMPASAALQAQQLLTQQQQVQYQLMNQCITPMEQAFGSSHSFGEPRNSFRQHAFSLPLNQPVRYLAPSSGSNTGGIAVAGGMQGSNQSLTLSLAAPSNTSNPIAWTQCYSMHDTPQRRFC